MALSRVLVICCLSVSLVGLSLAKTKTPTTKTHSGGAQYKSLESAIIPPGYVDGRRCNRECREGQTMSCFFNFPLETFYSMSKACFNCPSVLDDCWRPDCIIGGGIRRTVMVVNRQLPGPSIEVCQGDEVMVYLQNTLLDGEGTTIHWHGQHMVRDKYMDGVPWVTQCPIHWNNNFTYELWADNPGTFWWHSHVEMQRGDGCFGPMIVRQPRSQNPHANRYDFDLSEHVITITDWNDRLRLDVFQAYALAGQFLEPTGILVNGLGYQSNTNITSTPWANFTVQRGSRYRFRLINAGFFDCPLEFSIDGHKMLIIATDSQDLQPFEVDSFVSNSGERFDFVLTANQPVSTYYIRVKGYLTCVRNNIFTVASLRYQESPNVRPTGRMPTYATAAPTGGVLFNPLSVRNATGYSRVLSIAQPRAVKALGPGLDTDNVYRFYITVDMSGINNPLYHRFPYYGFDQVPPDFTARSPQFDRITHKNLDVPLLPARFYINQGVFCNERTMRNKNCENTFCACPHVISVPENAVVEFIFIELFDQDDAPTLHPIHLHGYSFCVLGWGEIGRNLTRQQVIRMDQQGLLRRNFVNPPLKDTVSVPKGGYTIVRFRASNVGYWLMHCHIDVHASEGMDIVLKVGDDRGMPDAPEDFPICGNWPRY